MSATLTVDHVDHVVDRRHADYYGEPSFVVEYWVVRDDEGFEIGQVTHARFDTDRFAASASDVDFDFVDVRSLPLDGLFDTVDAAVAAVADFWADRS